MEQTTKEAIAQRNGGKRLSGGAGKKPLIIIGILVAVLAAAYLGLCAYAASLDVFFPNTTINGVDVAGMTVQQAGEELGSTLPQRTMAFYLPLTDKSGDGVTAPEGETLYDPEPAATVSCESLGITQDVDYTAYAQSVYDRSQGQSGFFQGGWSSWPTCSTVRAPRRLSGAGPGLCFVRSSLSWPRPSPVPLRTPLMRWARTA